MINHQKIRRPMLALIAASALLLGGAAMPRFCLHNATMLYVTGQVRMAMGDREGGLRLISAAAQQSGQLEASVAPASNPKASTVAATVAPKCAKPVVPSDSGHAKFVVYSRSAEPSPASFMDLAQLKNVDFTASPFDQAKFAAEMRHAAELRSAANEKERRRTMARVRTELERRGIPVPPNVMGMGAPEAPMVPTIAP